MNTKFDDMRPYIDAEIPAAMQRIAQSEYLKPICDFVYPGKDIEEIKKDLLSFTTIKDFQETIMYQVNHQIIETTINHFSFDGIHHVDIQKKYLYISNHRDIMLDASLLQQAFHHNGFPRTEITFGSNLMSSQLMIDIGKSNKMFKVTRGGNSREFYDHLLRLSQYIRYAITEKGESVWMAQRNGRTKDGNDITDPGVIKMLCMSDNSDLVQSIGVLNIVPVAVSYQWEPCDFFKTRELYLSRDGVKYEKQGEEDLISILTGITQQKGNVHFCLCQPIEKEIYADLANELPNTFFKKIAQRIDERIYQNYHLWNTNYIAHDIRSGTNHYAAHYTSDEKDIFIQRLNQVLNQIDGDKEIISSIFLNIYANPVDKKNDFSSFLI